MIFLINNHMTYSFAELKKNIKETEGWLGGEYSVLHTGRATAAVLDKVFIVQYGSRQPLSHIASINIEDARTLMIVPWDKTMVKEIEKAIQTADIGLSVSAGESGVRVSFPELTGERRQSIVKIVKQKLEDARVAVRKEREFTWDDIQRKQKDGEISEDDKFRLKDDLQKIIDDANKLLEDMAKRKEKDIIGQ